MVVADWAGDFRGCLARRPARAADGPLLVVVEAPPALEADAAEIRRAIGTELRSRRLPRSDARRSARARTHRRARARSDRDIAARERRESVVRVIRRPPARSSAARDRLAGREPRPGSGDAHRRRRRPSKCRRWRRSPPAASPQAPMPPPPAAAPRRRWHRQQLEVPAVRHGLTTLTTNPGTATRSSWSIGAGGRTDDAPFHAAPQPTFGPGTGRPALCVSRRLRDRLGDLARHSTPFETRGFFTGAALEGTAGDFTPELIGATAFVGSAQQLGRWSFESGSLGGWDSNLGERTRTVDCNRNALDLGARSHNDVQDDCRFVPPFCRRQPSPCAHPVFGVARLRSFASALHVIHGRARI